MSTGTVDARLRVLDVAISGTLLVVLVPVFLAVAAAIKLESRGPVLYRCRRIGRNGDELLMLKFRKMRFDAAGGPLTEVDDERFTRIGRLLAKTKLDEIPQLWNVLGGGMSLVGPRPEDPAFVIAHPGLFDRVLRVRPGITGLSQVAFAREVELLDPVDRIGDYVRRLLPAKLRLDELFVCRRSVRLYLSILWWTVVAVAFRREVAVNRASGALNVRRRPVAAPADVVPVEGAIAS